MAEAGVGVVLHLVTDVRSQVRDGVLRVCDGDLGVGGAVAPEDRDVRRGEGVLGGQSAFVYNKNRVRRRTSRARGGIHPDKLATPPRSCSVEIATMRLRAAPCEKPTRRIRRASMPRWICARMRLSITPMLSAMPGSSNSSSPGGRVAISNQLGRRTLR